MPPKAGPSFVNAYTKIPQKILCFLAYNNVYHGLETNTAGQEEKCEQLYKEYCDKFHNQLDIWNSLLSVQLNTFLPYEREYYKVAFKYSKSSVFITSKEIKTKGNSMRKEFPKWLEKYLPKITNLKFKLKSQTQGEGMSFNSTDLYLELDSGWNIDQLVKYL